jgi:hypothetical protein
MAVCVIMKFGIRTPSLKKRIAARTSPARAIRHRLGLKAPRGAGWITDPKKAAYNRVYSRTTIDATKGSGFRAFILFAIIVAVVAFIILR